MYRLVAAPFLLILLVKSEIDIFKWLLAFSFFTDAIDGFLARRFKIQSSFGAKLDSIADDFTVFAGMAGLVMHKSDFLVNHLEVLIILAILFLFQIGVAMAKFRRTTSYHTYLAKVAAVFQGLFLIITFFSETPSVYLYYTAAIITLLDLAEEIIITFLLPSWQNDVKGIYWVIREKKSI